MVLIDANVMLRFLTDEQNERWAEGIRLIESGECFTLPEIISEVVYVLEKVYRVERVKVRESVVRVLEYVAIVQPEVILSALTYYVAYGVDFVDGILVSRALLLDDTVFTFDRKVQKLIQRRIP